MNLEGIDHIALSVRDLDEATRWYTEVLGFEPKFPGQWNGVPTFLAKGTTALALFPAHHATASAGPSHGARFLHLAFRADRAGFVAAQKELKERGIPFTFEDHKISHSIYFVDPDGHELEITTYEL